MRQKPIKVSRLDLEMQELLTKRGVYRDVITPLEYAQAYAGWHLGEESWADNILAAYDSVKALSND